LKNGFSLIILLVFLVTGCAAQLAIKPEADFKIKNVESASVTVNTILPDCKKEIEQIEKSLTAKLKEYNIFSKITDKSQSPDLIIKVEIEELVKVSKSERFWFGAMAGRGKVNGRITLIEEFSGKIIGSFYVESLTSGGSIFAGTTEQAINNFIEKIISFIQEKMIL
jgi:hypothetical protein